MRERHRGKELEGEMKEGRVTERWRGRGRQRERERKRKREREWVRTRKIEREKKGVNKTTFVIRDNGRAVGFYRNLPQSVSSIF